MDREELQGEVDALAEKYGEWLYDVPLPHGVWTAGKQDLPHTRLKRVAQVIADTVRRPISECRILDLGCFEGQFAIEMALQGATAVGIEIRESNIEKGRFIQRVLGLDKLSFHQDDVRNVSVETFGRFDAIICSGILYHLPAADVVRMIEDMFAMATGVVVIDTHVALAPEVEFHHEGMPYWGKIYVEHSERATPEEKARVRLASADNVTSFWFTRPSLTNLLSRAGFSSVYECFSPPHLNFGRPGLESLDRCTFVAVKGEEVELATSPAANGLREAWPERALTYAPVRKALFERARSAAIRLLRGRR